MFLFNIYVLLMKQKLFFCIIIFFQFMGCTQKINYGNNKEAGKYALINGAKIYYETYGEGSPLLFIHGNSGSIVAFENQLPFFSKYFHVIAVDSRLQGKSGGNADTLSYEMMANDCCALLDYLHLDSAYVIGWSDGGVNGLLMAMQCPAKVKALAVSGANVLPDTAAFSAADVVGMQNYSANNPGATTVEKTLNRLMQYQPVIPYENLAKIKCPVLVMAGDEDVIKESHTKKIAQSIPGAKLCIFPNSNHGVCQQHPALFNKTVYDFFIAAGKAGRR